MTPVLVLTALAGLAAHVAALCVAFGPATSPGRRTGGALAAAVALVAMIALLAATGCRDCA